MSKILLLLCCSLGLGTISSAQNLNVPDFNTFLYGKPIHKTAAGLDSVRIAYPVPIYSNANNTVEVMYVGQLKEGRPEGLGTFFSLGGPIYTGQWHNGKAEGQGIMLQGKLYNYRWKFRGEFREGLPVNGSVRYSAEEEVFYTGEVKLNTFDMSLLPHGFGRFFVSPGARHWLFIGGAYHEGQFIEGAPTGYAVYNTVEGITTPLKVGLTLVGLEVHAFDNLGISANMMGWNALVPGTTWPAALKKILPEIDKCVFDSIPLARGVTYYGQVYQKDPYGLGIIKYPDGLADYGFWKKGELISTTTLLKTLLPDSAMLEPVAAETFYPTLSFTVDKKLKKYERKPIPVLSNEKRKVLYYASMKNGMPEGWGWAIDTAKDGLAIAARFSGIPNPKEWSADTTYLQVSGEIAYGLKYPTLQWNNQPTRVPLRNGGHTLSWYPVAMSRTGQKLAVDAFVYGSAKLRPTSAMADPYTSTASIKQLREEQAAKAQQMSARMANRPTTTVLRAVVYSKTPASSYIVTASGNLTGTWVTPAEVQPGDAVFTGKGFDYANVHGLTPFGTPQYGGKYWVIRSHNLKNNTQESTCTACNGTGGTTSTKSIDIQDGYKTSVNYNTPGYANGALVYTPNMKSVGTYQSKSVCSVCKGRPYNKTNATVVEYR